MAKNKNLLSINHPLNVEYLSLNRAGFSALMLLHLKVSVVEVDGGHVGVPGVDHAADAAREEGHVLLALGQFVASGVHLLDGRLWQAAMHHRYVHAGLLEHAPVLSNFNHINVITISIFLRFFKFLQGGLTEKDPNMSLIFLASTTAVASKRPVETDRSRHLLNTADVHDLG